MEYKAKSFNLGFISDAHGKIDKLDQIINKHPKIEQWFFLGDLFCFRNPANNPEAYEWFFKNKDKYLFIIGNHDAVCTRNFIRVTFEQKHVLAGYLNQNITITLPNKEKLFLCHSKERDFWTFVEKNYTEREFVDDYTSVEDYKAVIIGHNHQQFKLVFPNTSAEIWSIGASCYNEYAILNEKGIQLKKI